MVLKQKKFFFCRFFFSCLTKLIAIACIIVNKIFSTHLSFQLNWAKLLQSFLAPSPQAPSLSDFTFYGPACLALAAPLCIFYGETSFFD